MVDPRVPLKHPVIAGILAFLIPGAGHFYQGRLFKACIYAVCILGLFFTGMAVAGWKAVQAPPKPENGRRNVVKILKYSAQSAVGLPALYALVQRSRFYAVENVPIDQIDEPFSAPFEGVAEYRGEDGIESGAIIGTIRLEPVQTEFGKPSIAGGFIGTMDGEQVEFKLSAHTEVAKPIEASERREVLAGIVTEKEGQQNLIGQLSGHMPRPFMDWYQVPMDDQEEQELHRELGKFHELAMVFTWVAGLLNILAIWDAVEGPAYGYGDEEKEQAEEPNTTT